MSPEVETARAKMEDKRVRRKDSEEVPRKRQKTEDLINTKTGGAYIPPARLRMMQAQITDKSSAAYQRLAWEALKKSIHGHINKINVGNIGVIIKELLKENIVRGRGLLCRSIIQAQAASPTFTNVYAALVSAINSRFPNIGELLLKRLVISFKRGFKRNDKPLCISSASFIAHLVNQKVAHEILALELLTLLVETPSDDSVEVAIAFLKECGQKLLEVSSKGVNAIFEMLRNILHEGQLDKRVQYMIEVMFQVWKDGFKDHPAVQPELELVPEEEQFTHLMMLDEATDPQDILNVFKFDEKYEENEQKYKGLVKEILGSDAESGDEQEGSGGSGSEETDDSDDDDEKPKDVTIIDNTETNLVALRRTIYLTINSSLDFEECAHKLMKMQLKPGQEIELCNMFLDCCAEQRTYEKFYGLLSQRFCEINKIYIEPFEGIFKNSYGTAHRLDTNRLRNVSKFFAHLLFTDSISWEVLDCVKLNEEDTTSSSRIYIKILFQELAEYMGLKKLNDRLRDPTLQDAFAGIFPRDNPKNTRFSINFFTSIGLGGLTDELREFLKQMPKTLPQQLTAINLNSSSSSSSDSDSSDSSDSLSSSSSDSDTENDESEKKKSEKNKSKKNSDRNNKSSKLSKENKKDDDKRPKRNKDNDSSNDDNEETRNSRDERNKAKDKSSISNRITEHDSREPRKERFSSDMPHHTRAERDDNNRRESDTHTRSQRSNRDIEKDIRDVERELENRRKQDKERNQNRGKENDRRDRERNLHENDSNRGNKYNYGESRTDSHIVKTSQEISKRKDDRRDRKEHSEKDRKDAATRNKKENNYERNKREEKPFEERYQRRTRTPEARNITEIKKVQDSESQSKINKSRDRNRKNENTTDSDHDSRQQKGHSDNKDQSRDRNSKKSKGNTDLSHYQDKKENNKYNRENHEEQRHSKSAKATTDRKKKKSEKSKRKEVFSSQSSSSSGSSSTSSDSDTDDGKSKKGHEKVYSRYYDFDIKTVSQLRKEDKSKKISINECKKKNL